VVDLRENRSGPLPEIDANAAGATLVDVEPVDERPIEPKAD
jgi:hypothetical protein